MFLTGASQGVDLGSEGLAGEEAEVEMVEPRERRVSAIQDLGRPTRLETEDERCRRGRLLCPEFCWARGDCCCDVLGPGFAAPQGALKVLIKDQGATADDPEAALVLKQRI